MNGQAGVRFSPKFYRGAALCSMASAVTTLGLIFLPRLYQPVADLDARMALTENNAYVLRSWIYLFHPFLVMTAAVAVAARCRFRAAGSAALGALGFVIWGTAEAAQQTFTIFGMDRTWRAAWPAADEAARQAIVGHVAMYDAIWNALYVLLLLGFLAGNVFLALAARGGTGLARWVCAAFAAAAVLTLVIIVSEFGGPQLTSGLAAWLYPTIQPAGRALVGVWLWREATAEQPSSAGT